MRITAAFSPNASAVMPDITAPKAYPRSRHNRNVPILSARCMGFVACAIVDKKVGYTRAVPKPSVPESMDSAKNEVVNGRKKMAIP